VQVVFDLPLMAISYIASAAPLLLSGGISDFLPRKNSHEYGPNSIDIVDLK
jgi:hypothetical protein